MRKTTLLNSNIGSVISKMGHTDMLAIGDCGLSIQNETERIDIMVLCQYLGHEKSNFFYAALLANNSH